MPEIAFLLGDVSLARNDNHERLPAAFESAGWTVHRLPQEAVRLTPEGVRLAEADPERFQLIWLIGMGRVQTFFDRMQILRLVPQHAFVNPVDALLHRHAKYAWWPLMPETHASSDAGYLKSVLRQGGDWVVKPPAGSFGRGVKRLSPGAAAEAELERLTAAGHFLLLQRFVAQIAQGEKRTLVAGGEIVGTYLRLPRNGFHANLAEGGTARPAELDAGERALVEQVSGELSRHGIGFAAVDTAYPYLMEVNLANPGGLATLEQLTGRDPAPRAVEALTRWRSARQ